MSLFLKGLIGRIWLLLALLLCLQSIALADLKRVVVIKSSENAYYDETIATLKKHTGPLVTVEAVLMNDFKAPGSASLLIALGQTAAEQTAALLSSLASDTPVINAYLTVEQFHSLRVQRNPTIVLDQPLARYLAFSQFALPIESIGILTQHRTPLDAETLTRISHLPLDVRQYEINAQNKLLPVLRELLQDNDALLMLPRQSLYNHDSLRGVLVTSYRHRKPVVSYSPAHIRSGALASIYSSPVDIGQHLSILMHRNLDETNNDNTKLHFARFYSIALNPKSASALGIMLPSEEEIRQKLDRLMR